MYTYELSKLKTADKNINIFKSHGTCPVHTHEFVEIVYVYEGACTHWVDGKEYDMQVGDMLFVNYGQTHSIRDREHAKFYNIEYTPDFFSSELMGSENLYDIFEYLLLDERMGEQVLPIEKLHFDGQAHRAVQNILDEMFWELSEKKQGYRNALHGFSRVLFSKIMRKALSERLPSEDSVHKIVRQCIAYIDKKYFEKLTLSQIAENTYYNPSYLSRIFKKYCGRNLWDYLKEKRLEEAARLLHEQDDTVERVMEMVGYSDKKKFYKDFKVHFACSPGEYRKSKKILPTDTEK